MSTPSSTPASRSRVPLLQKSAYGLGMLGNQMFPAALGIFMVVLVQSLGMNTVLWGILFFLPRLSDALTDPVMGYISDNTKSRWGRRRPYIFIGAIVAGLSYIFMWQLNPDPEVGEWFRSLMEKLNLKDSDLYPMYYNFTYFLLLSFVFYLGLTIFATPYVAMGYEMSDDFHERTRLMAVAQWIGQWAWVIVPWFWVILYDQRIYPDAVAGARNLAIWVGLGCMIMAMMPALFCKTQPVDPSTQEELSLRKAGDSLASLFKGFGATFRCMPFVRLCLATFFVFNAFNTVAGFSFFIIVHYMFHGVTGPEGSAMWPTWFGCVGALTTAFLAIPIVTYLSGRFGKKIAFIISQSLSVIGYISFWWCFNPNNPWLLFLPLPLFSFGIGSLFTLMMSMTADVCDLDELNTGARREGAFGAVYWWMVKFGFAIAGLGGGLIMKWVGFDSGAATQTPEAMTGMRLAYIILPALGTLIAIIIMLGYDLTEQRSHEIREQIAQRKKADA